MICAHPYCTNEVVQPARGRRKRYCSRACQVASLRAKTNERGTAFTVRMSPEMLRQLHEAADERVVSTSVLARQLLREGLENLIPVEETRYSRRPEP